MKWDSLLDDGFDLVAGAVSGGLDSYSLAYFKRIYSKLLYS